MSRRYVTRRIFAEIEGRLTDHDKTILRSVSDLRFMTGDQLGRMHFGEGDANARATRRALVRLTRLELLARLPRQVGGVRAGSAGFVYCLGLAGQKLAFASGWQPPRRGRRPKVPGRLFLAHRLEVAELHVRLTLADRAGKLDLLELVAEPLCHRQYVGLGNQRVLKPDSFLRYAQGEWEHAWFIEVDRGTEGSGAIQTKLREYLRFEASGIEQTSRGLFPKVLWTVPDEARGEVIRGEIEQLPRGGRELFAVSLFEEAIEAMTTSEAVAES